MRVFSALKSDLGVAAPVSAGMREDARTPRQAVVAHSPHAAGLTPAIASTSKGAAEEPADEAFDYFGAFAKQVGYCEEVVQNLLSGFEAGEMGTAPLMEALHTVENDADAVNHDIRAHLVADGQVTLNRYALMQLADSLETATDAIEEIAIAGYIYGARYMQDPMHEVLEYMADASTLLKEAHARIGEPTRYRAGILCRLGKVAEYEKACDRIFIRSMHALYADDVLTGEDRQITAALYQKLEDAMDALQHVGENIESVVSQMQAYLLSDARGHHCPSSLK